MSEKLNEKLTEEKKLKNILSKGKSIAEKTVKLPSEATKSAKEYWIKNKDDFHAQGRKALKTGHEYAKHTYDSAVESATNLYHNLKYSEQELKNLEKRIENQGGYYRELNRSRSASDAVVLGGETLVSLLAAGAISDQVIRAYEGAYPDLSQNISFADKVRELKPDELTGFTSGVKGKLFELQYVDYLNNGNLPNGYTAVLADSANQPGWDIAIEGANSEIVKVIQAKATDSVSYVKEAVDKYPDIDVVTTDEVYSQLVMNGISENITNSTITNVGLLDILGDSVDASELTMDFSPPLFSLAFIAFTSYKDQSLTLYEKARNAGDRTGKTYLSYLIGGGIAAATNTWWLGVVGSVGSRLLSDRGKRKLEVYEKLKDVEETNQKIIERLKADFSNTDNHIQVQPI